jgi:ubiquinone/menaquinone biosynthesis C-methylase UbiE
MTTATTTPPIVAVCCAPLDASGLSTDKPAVVRETFRVLKTGGRVGITDTRSTTTTVTAPARRSVVPMASDSSAPPRRG